MPGYCVTLGAFFRQITVDLQQVFTVMDAQSSPELATLKLVLPKGRIQEKVQDLLAKVGVTFASTSRSYRPVCNRNDIDIKILKPQNIAALVGLGRHDCGFTGHDWVQEQKANVVELLDLGFDPVQIVAAVPEAFAQQDLAQRAQQTPLVVASEYRHLTERYLQAKGIAHVFIQSYGATEALPPEDADMIVDNTATGSTLRMNRLVIVDELLRSTTRFVAHPQALEDPVKRAILDELVMLMRSTLDAQRRVLLEMNVSPEAFDAVVAMLPAMRSPTVSSLHGQSGFAIKVAVPSPQVPGLIPKLVQAGATDILAYKLEKIVAGL
ncbi:MAG: ATP phosphoribosyltransferase [Vampirovibrionales bacterium]|nr:ATP phosphoribosyltransferase [Vampirovibrionales bacterium]